MHSFSKTQFITSSSQTCDYQQRDSNSQALSLLTSTQPFSQTDQMIVRTYMYGALDCMFLSCHVRISEWIYTLYFDSCQGTPCSKQARYLKSQQRDLNRHSLSLETNTQPFSQTDQMFELCCDYLTVRCIWLYVIIMSCTRFRVNLHTILVSRKDLGFLSRKNRCLMISL